MKLNNNILTEMIKKELNERRVALSGQKDANFGRDYVQLMGKAGMLKLTKKDVHALAKFIRSKGGAAGMGWSFTAFEGKLNEGKVVRLPSGHKVKVEFKGLTFSATRGKDVFLDRSELQRFFKATRKYLYK